jgi:hypothetical protein
MRRNPGRVAGLIYLLLVLFAPFSLIYVPNQLFRDDPAATAHNIAAHQMLFRAGMVGDLACSIVLVFLALALYRLFKGVNRDLAMMVVILGGILPAAVDIFNLLNDAGALMAARGAPFLSAFTEPQRDALVMLFMRLHGQVIRAAESLWGLWLFPLAILTWRSNLPPRFLPRAISVWLIVNGVAYLALCLVGLLAPQYEDTVSNLAFPAQLGEIAFVLWLLIRGVAEGELGPPIPE